MRETQAIIERVRHVTPELQQIELSADAALSQLQAGQSLFARTLENTGWTPYLREQWIPVAVQSGHITVELPTGRAGTHTGTSMGTGTYTPGQAVSLLSPVGQPIPLRPNLRQMLLVAQAAPTPLLLLAHRLIADGVAVTMVLGEDARRYPLELLPPEVEILRSDTQWKWPDRVETLNWADQVIALAPPADQAVVYGGLYDMINQLRHQAVPDYYVCGMFYERLGCGTGACLACQVPARGKTLLSCTDGPAIDLKRVKLQ